MATKPPTSYYNSGYDCHYHSWAFPPGPILIPARTFPWALLMAKYTPVRPYFLERRILKDARSGYPMSFVWKWSEPKKEKEHVNGKTLKTYYRNWWILRGTLFSDNTIWSRMGQLGSVCSWDLCAIDVMLQRPFRLMKMTISPIRNSISGDGSAT